MTAKEEKGLQNLQNLLEQIRKENQEFKEQINLKVAEVNQKNIQFTFEADIIQSVQQSITKSLGDFLGGYNSPLSQYAKNIVVKYQADIEATFDSIVSEAIKTDEFKTRVREVLLHKIAKTVTSGIDGSIDKTVNLMKQNQVFRSKLTLAINEITNEFLKQGEKNV